LELPQDVSSG